MILYLKAFTARLAGYTGGYCGRSARERVALHSGTLLSELFLIFD